MSFKRLSIVTVFILVALFLAGRVLAAVVASLTIQDQQIDLGNPDAQININLPGNPGEAQTFNIPIVITYDDGSTKYLAYIFNYVPTPTPTPSSQNTCPYQEEPQNCQYGGTRGCTGTWQDGVCKYDGSIDPNCTETCNPGSTPAPSVTPACANDTDCADGNPCTNDSCINGQCGYSNKSEGEVCERDRNTYEPIKTCDSNGSCSQSVGGSEPPPPPEPSCGDFEYKYWECDWNNQQTYDVYQDSCGNYDRRDYHTVEGLCGAPE